MRYPSIKSVIPAMRDWYQQHVTLPRQNAKALRYQKAHEQTPKVRTSATVDDLAAIKAIGRVNYCPATATKRFARQIQGVTELTGAQRLYLWQIVWRFRRQIKDTRLVELAKRITTPKGGSQ